MLRALYDWMLRLSAKPQAAPALAAVAFLESSLFPLPPDIMLAPMALTQRARAWHLAALCTLASVAGAAAGYAIGYYLFETVGDALVALYGWEAALDEFRRLYDAHGSWLVLFAAVSFVPFKVATIASGALAMNPLNFLLASLIGRGARFFAVAALCRVFGAPILRIIDRWFHPIMLGLALLLLAGFWLVRVP